MTLPVLAGMWFTDLWAYSLAEAIMYIGEGGGGPCRVLKS